jgi:hypothetical protein
MCRPPGLDFTATPTEMCLCAALVGTGAGTWLVVGGSTYIPWPLPMQQRRWREHHICLTTRASLWPVACCPAGLPRPILLAATRRLDGPSESHCWLLPPWPPILQVTFATDADTNTWQFGTLAASKPCIPRLAVSDPQGERLTFLLNLFQVSSANAAVRVCHISFCREFFFN